MTSDFVRYSIYRILHTHTSTRGWRRVPLGELHAQPRLPHVLAEGGVRTRRAAVLDVMVGAAVFNYLGKNKPVIIPTWCLCVLLVRLPVVFDTAGRFS